ncbi:MAG: hypothetical protein COS95_04005 [Ignavibacteriales bacterium CG07_land_8_20_14_0_80_59_12]|nr:MAG: hypothetical protein COS95_04005 [Ignavibacteriales bacterium CG07_land_8_20_14_0_80_59_12]
MSMSALDIIIFVVLVLAFFWGFREGAIRKVLSLVGAVAGIILALRWSRTFGRTLSGTLGSGELAGQIIAFILILVAAMAVANLLGHLASRLTPGIIRLSDRLVGGAIGTIEGLLVLSGALLVLALVDVPAKETQQASHLYRPVTSFAPMIVRVITSVFPETRSLQGAVNDELKKLTSPGSKGQ